MITFRLATEDDALRVGGSLREVDRLELARGTGHDPVNAPVRSVHDSTISWCAADSEGPIAVFGVAPDRGVPGQGIVWFLAVDRAERYGREFLAKGRYYVSLMAKLYPTLTNAVDSENLRTRRWLGRLGFVEEPEMVLGRLTNHPFVIVTYKGSSSV